MVRGAMATDHDSMSARPGRGPRRAASMRQRANENPRPRVRPGAFASAMCDRCYFCRDCTISCVTFFASPNSIIVFGRKNSSFSTPA